MAPLLAVCITAGTPCVRAEGPGGDAVPETAPRAAEEPAPRLPEPADPLDERPFLIRPLIDFTSLDLSLLSLHDDDEQSVEYSPNFKLQGGMRLGYRGYGFTFATSLGDSDTVEELRQTDSFELQLDNTFTLGGRSLVAAIYYSSVQGFYVANSEEVDPAWQPGQARLLGPGLHLVHTGMSASLYFDPQFSPIDVFHRIRHGRSTTDSFVLRASLDYNLVQANDSLIPDPVKPELGAEAELRGNRAVILSLAPGYVLDVFFGDVFITTMAYAGVEVLYQEYELGTVQESEANVDMMLGARLSMGYAGELVHLGAFMGADMTSATVGATAVSLFSFDSGAYVGFRF